MIEKPLSRVSLIQAVSRLLRASPLRGLARVAFETRVHLSHSTEALWGTARNLSRGGIFVEVPCSMPPRTEVSLEFALPDGAAPLAPTAQVIWRRLAAGGNAEGMGLQFLALDRESARRIDEYVYERAARGTPLASAAGGAP